MGKNSFYFDHDYNARGDEKILSLRVKKGWEGYGIFFGTLEILCEAGGFIQRGALAGLSLGFNISVKKYTEYIDLFISLELLTETSEGIYSERILKHVDFRKKLSAFGSKGGRGNRKPPFSPPLAPLEASKERKGKEIKESKENKENKENDSYCFSIAESILRIKEMPSWKEHIQRVFKISLEETENYLTIFFDELLLKGEMVRSVNETKSHFINWLKKQHNGKVVKMKAENYSDLEDVPLTPEEQRRKDWMDGKTTEL